MRKLNYIKKFDELSEGFFSLKERIFDPIRFKKMAKKYFDICKGDLELLNLVGDFIDEYPSYSEGPDPRPASSNLRSKINELFPETNNKELYELRIVRGGLTESNDVTTVYNYLVSMLVNMVEKNN
jgi:hypothetical protein